jgi:hypothetical protein
MLFETEENLAEEKKAIQSFVSLFSGSYQKLDPFDIDFKVFDKNKNLVAYVEVKGCSKPIHMAFPLMVSVRKLIKLTDKRIKPVCVWACPDGIIYSDITKIKGRLEYGGRKPRVGSSNDLELMAYYDKQKEFKYLRYS